VSLLSCLHPGHTIIHKRPHDTSKLTIFIYFFNNMGCSSAILILVDLNITTLCNLATSTVIAKNSNLIGSFIHNTHRYKYVHRAKGFLFYINYILLPFFKADKYIRFIYKNIVHPVVLIRNISPCVEQTPITQSNTQKDTFYKYIRHSTTPYIEKSQHYGISSDL